MIPKELLDVATPEERAEVDRLLLAPPDFLYANDPFGWMHDVLGIPRELIQWSLLPGYDGHRWDGTPDPLFEVCEAIRQGQDCGVESATGTGKTFLAAGLALWFHACFEDSLVITTAPKEDQLTAQLWKEIGRFWPRFHARYPQATTVKLRVRMKDGQGESEIWAIWGYACGIDAGAQSATRAQGFHAKHMLQITEETPGIDPSVMAALANTATGTHNVRLALGNPDSQLDTLHLFCIEPGVRHIRVSGYDHPNVVLNRDIVPGAVTRKSLTKLAGRWAPGSAMYDSRARGISPAQSVDALIQLAWCQQAAARKLTKGARALGVDVAQSENGDKAAIARGAGPVLLEVEEFPCPNATQLGRDVATEARRDGIPASLIGVDPIGVGAACVNELRERVGPDIQALNGGDSPVDGAQRLPDGSTRSWAPDANEHRNLRGQMYWQLREDLRLGVIQLPNDPELFRELTMTRWEPKNGLVWVESKIEVRKRLGRSPDKADSVVYWNWVRPRDVSFTAPEIPVKQDDRAVRWDHTKRRPIEVSPEEAFNRDMGLGGSEKRSGEWEPGGPNW